MSGIYVEGSSKPHYAYQPICRKLSALPYHLLLFYSFLPFPGLSPLTFNIQFPISLTQILFCNHNTPPTLLPPLPGLSSLTFNIQFPLSLTQILFSNHNTPPTLLTPLPGLSPLTFNSSSKSGAKQSAYPPCILCTQEEKNQCCSERTSGGLATRAKRGKDSSPRRVVLIFFQNKPHKKREANFSSPFSNNFEVISILLCQLPL